NSETPESFMEKLEKRHVDMEISEFEIQNNLELEKPVVQSFEFEKEGAYEIIGGKIYFSPMFYLATLENPFKAETREFPVDYGYPWEDKYIITIAIPEGYVVESIPEPMAIVLTEGMGQFRYNITAGGNQINVRVEESINTPIVPSHYYADLKEFFRHIVEKESEKIILTKA
ncbi:MAG: transglutaminase, partial [Flavobacteriia bacterium]